MSNGLEAVLRGRTALPDYVASADGALVYVSPRLRRFLRPTGSDAADDRALLDRLSEIFAAIRRDMREVVDHIEVPVDGESRAFLAYHFPIRGALDKLAGFGGTYVDAGRIVAAWRSTTEDEERLRDILRSTCEWTWETDAHLNLTVASDGMGSLLGMPLSQIKGRYLLSLGEFAPTPEHVPYPRPDRGARAVPRQAVRRHRQNRRPSAPAPEWRTRLRRTRPLCRLPRQRRRRDRPGTGAGPRTRAAAPGGTGDRQAQGPRR